LKRHRNK